MACAINLGSSVILTGGYHTRTTVSQYNEAGWVRDLPDLLQGRYYHGCTSYDNNDGTQVDIDIILSRTFRIILLFFYFIYLYYISIPDHAGSRGLDWQCLPLLN